MKIRTLVAAVAATVALLGVGMVGTATAASAAPAGRAGPIETKAVVTYVIKVKTGDLENAGTDSNVQIRLNGSLGRSGFIDLEKPGDDRQRGKIDEYTKLWTDLGALRSIDIKFTRMGDGAGWYLDYVSIDPSNRAVSYFPHYRWFSQNGIRNIPVA